MCQHKPIHDFPKIASTQFPPQKKRKEKINSSMASYINSILLSIYLFRIIRKGQISEPHLQDHCPTCNPRVWLNLSHFTSILTISHLALPWPESMQMILQSRVFDTLLDRESNPIRLSSGRSHPRISEHILDSKNSTFSQYP